ncbi:Asp/Glu racemase [Burkholderia multivorans]|uniref:maleate cis-trans isomerase family protein n=1 Tax=Burkholderia multivorans TaxID=87883 RepID=UPI001C21BFFA|nr:aspartate/glutamate racemase family protein [Burkholderia multivorans]MBU9228077.1 Asp/Glu racemase [Burkholderia multivorans]HDV6318751.1 Asp/Glu racemase [Burkholderia multivorans]
MKHYETGIDVNGSNHHNPRPRIGLIALASDLLVERDFWRLGLAAGVDIITTRIAQSMPLTPATLARLEDGIPDAVRLLLPDANLDAIVFACTSGSAIIGPSKLASKISAVRPDVPVIDPATASVEALRYLGCRRIAFIAPYTADVAEITSGVFSDAAIGFSDRVCFGLQTDVEIAIPGLDHYRRAVAAADTSTADAIFLSCTTAATLDLIAPLEAETGLPVITSNQAAFWHTLRVMGRPTSIPGLGRLLA